MGGIHGSPWQSSILASNSTAKLFPVAVAFVHLWCYIWTRISLCLSCCSETTLYLLCENRGGPKVCFLTRGTGHVSGRNITPSVRFYSWSEQLLELQALSKQAASSALGPEAHTRQQNLRASCSLSLYLSLYLTSNAAYFSISHEPPLNV